MFVSISSSMWARSPSVGPAPARMPASPTFSFPYGSMSVRLTSAVRTISFSTPWRVTLALIRNVSLSMISSAVDSNASWG